MLINYMLPQFTELNDYEYVIAPLFNDQSYYNYVVSAGRVKPIIIDPGYYEGLTIDTNKYVDIINKFSNDAQTTNFTYVIPAFGESLDEIIKTTYNWVNKYNHLPGKKMLYLGGTCYGCIMSQLNMVWSLNLDYFGIYWNNTAFKNSYTFIQNNYERLTYSRQMLLELIYMFYPTLNNRIHLYGYGMANEFKYYTKDKQYLKAMIHSINALDVIASGIEGIKLSSNATSLDIKITDVINFKQSITIKNMCINNVNTFKNINSI
ncbi:MAG: hypothetical protein QXV17_01410 [Candidatus Micrarchaeaceae archaeon]